MGFFKKNTSYILLTQTFLFKIHSAKPCNLSALSKEPNRVYTETDNLILNSMLPPSCPLWEKKYKQHHIRMIRNLLVRFRATDATLDHTDVILERCRAPTKSCFLSLKSICDSAWLRWKINGAPFPGSNLNTKDIKRYCSQSGNCSHGVILLHFDIQWSEKAVKAPLLLSLPKKQWRSYC